MDTRAPLAFRPSLADREAACPEMPLLFSCFVAVFAFVFGALLAQAVADGWALGYGARLFLLITLSLGPAFAAAAAVQAPLSRLFQSGATAWRRALGDGPERRCLLLAAAALDAFPHLRALPEGSLWHVVWFVPLAGDVAEALSVEVHTPDGRSLEVPVAHPALAPFATLPCPRAGGVDRPRTGITFSMRMPAPSAHLRLALRHAATTPSPARAPFWKRPLQMPLERSLS